MATHLAPEAGASRAEESGSQQRRGHPKNSLRIVFRMLIAK